MQKEKKNMNYSTSLNPNIQQRVTGPQLGNPNSQLKRNIPIQQLTLTQMDEKRTKGLCFNYDEKFHRGHICKSKLFVMLINEEVENNIDWDNTKRWCWS